MKAPEASRVHGHLGELDGLRGVAAVMVLALHAKDLLGANLAPHSAYLAVDFFFCLSGFVLCYAYRTRLAEGLSVRDFFILRLIRLGPLFVCGTTMGLAVAILAALAGKGEIASHARDSLIGIVGLVGVPAPPFRSATALYPLDVAAWSLFFEILANILFALTYRFIGRRLALAGMAVALMCVVAGTWQYGSLEGGNDWRSMPLGLARICFSFPAGCLIFAVWSKWNASRSPLWAWMAYPLLVLLLILDIPGSFRPVYDLGCVCIGFPVIVLFAASRPGRAKVAGLEYSLGKASYAIYITHVPLGFLYAAVLARIAGVSADSLAPWSRLLFIPCMYGGALFLDRYIDTPIRQRLMQRRQATRLPLASAPT